MIHVTDGVLFHRHFFREPIFFSYVSINNEKDCSENNQNYYLEYDCFQDGTPYYYYVPPHFNNFDKIGQRLLESFRAVQE